jgi:hypothetical protein
MVGGDKENTQSMSKNILLLGILLLPVVAQEQFREF